MKTVVFVRSSGALCLLLLLLHLNSRAQGVGPNAAPAGRVVGQVLDFDPQKPEFVIEGAGVKQAVRVDEDGNYKVKLPPGVYRILTPGGSKAVPPSHVFRRASFRVNPGATVRIDIRSIRDRVYCTPYGKDLLVIAEVWEGQGEEPEDPHPNYETLWLPESAKVPRDVVVEYCGKEESGGMTLYKNATLTHDKFSITAAYLKLSKNTFLLRAKGREVIMEDGSRTLTVRDLSADLIKNQFSYRRRSKQRRKR